ncbi:hypothetical protein [Halopseudomonas sabulinigri]
MSERLAVLPALSSFLNGVRLLDFHPANSATRHALLLIYWEVKRQGAAAK